MKLLITLGVLLVLVSAYALIASGNLGDINDVLNGSTILEKLNETAQIAYQVGQRVGYETAVIELANLAATCNPVPVTLQNVTFEVIAVDCLN